MRIQTNHKLAPCSLDGLIQRRRDIALRIVHNADDQSCKPVGGFLNDLARSIGGEPVRNNHFHTV